MPRRFSYYLHSKVLHKMGAGIGIIEVIMVNVLMEREIAKNVIICVHNMITYNRNNNTVIYSTGKIDYTPPDITGKTIREIIEIFRAEIYVIYARYGLRPVEEMTLARELYARAIKDISECIQPPLSADERVEFNELKIRYDNLCSKVETMKGLF